MFSRTTRFLAVFTIGVAVAASLVAADPPESPEPAARDTRPLGPVGAREAVQGAVRAPAGPGTVRTVAALGAVLGVIFIGAALFKRFAGRNQSFAGSLGAAGKSPAGIMEIVGRYPLGRGSTLVLLRLDKRILLLSQTASASGRGVLRMGTTSLTTLCEITGANDVASILAKARDADGESISARFQTLLSGFTGEPEAVEAPATSPAQSSAVAAPLQARHAAQVAPAFANELDDVADESPTVVVRAGSWSSAGGGA